MIIEKLEIHNIASIADATIDFQGKGLGCAPIFLISGETGAGKTTILDAICLALYSDTPRMNSSSREEISIFGDGRNKLYSNDNSQLLRRGTGEGFVKLTFEGNDGKLYEAVWSVQRDHKKPHKKLQKPSRSLRSVLDDSYQETHKREIEEKIVEITGLEYDQFCRTVVLAQGEFTKFLKSNKGEKSQILEKLTGTEIYSELGSRLSSKYNEIKSKWESAYNEMKNISILGEEELKELKSELETLQNTRIENNNLSRSINEKINWSHQFDSLKKREKQTSENVTKLTAAINSEEFQADCNLIKEYRFTENARILLKEKTKLENTIFSHKKKFPSLEERHNSLLKEEKTRNEEIKDIQKKLLQKNDEIDKIDIKEVNKRISELNINRNIIVELSAVNEKLINLNKKLEEAIHEAEEYDKDLNKHEETLKLKRSDKEKAEVIRKAAYKEYDQLLAYSSEAAKGLRALVRVGDLCPVCGQKVMKHLKDNIFDEISRSTLEAKTQAEEQYNRVEAEIIAENKIIDELKKSINKILKRIEETKNEKVIISSNYSSLIQKSGLSIKETDNLEPILEKELNDIKQRIEKEEKSQQHYIELSEELKTIQAYEVSHSAKLETIKSQIKKTEEDLTIWKTTLKEKNERLAECNDKLRLFFLTNKNIEEKRLEELNKLDSLFITTLEEEIQKTRDSLNSESGGLEALRNEIKILNERKPKFDENESISELEKEKKNLENKIKEIDVRFGVLNERLRLNDENLTKIEIKKKEEEKIRSEKEQWESLYKYLGDQDGMKFRAVAQSFILKSLLYNANAYMTTFSDRYTLTCNPGSLAILVKDELHPSEPQPVSILSGGESFMASLSLALALSNLRGGGVGVDILFIDEGFGTLSPEYLGNVMETLEKLHHIGGRKVGLISHVPEMKERIPVQIHVHRESPILSKVEVKF